jgi:hypothetical protein
MGALVTFLAAPSAAAAPPPPDNPIPEDVGSGLISIPPGCVVHGAADVAFVGTAVAKDFEKVRFEIVQLRAGSASGYAIDGLIDVLYLEDAKFLDVDEEYLVGARFDPELGGLFSNVRAAEPLFGGNDVIGLNDTDVECPVIDDPARTLQPNGESVDSGVATPLFRDKRLLLATLACRSQSPLRSLSVLSYSATCGAWSSRASSNSVAPPSRPHRTTHRFECASIAPTLQRISSPRSPT